MKKSISLYILGSVLCAVLVSMTFIKPTQLLKTKLHVTVRNELGNLITGAKVQLFATKADYDASKNQLTTKDTNEKGIAVFTDLEEKVYFVNVEKGEANNFNAATQTDTLKVSRTNKVTIIISD